MSKVEKMFKNSATWKDVNSAHFRPSLGLPAQLHVQCYTNARIYHGFTFCLLWFHRLTLKRDNFGCDGTFWNLNGIRKEILRRRRITNSWTDQMETWVKNDCITIRWKLSQFCRTFSVFKVFLLRYFIQNASCETLKGLKLLSYTTPLHHFRASSQSSAIDKKSNFDISRHDILTAVLRLGFS